MLPRPASVAACVLAILSMTALARPSQAYPTVEGQPARYVIITGDELAQSFKPLADARTRGGLPALVRTMSEVIAAHPVAFDDAERVRLDLRDAWLAGAQWVLLGGGPGVVPQRYARTTFFGGQDLLTDLYFQCLEGTWDADGDHLYGEGFFSSSLPGDSADLGPDVWLGRVPVLTPGEARRFVNKTLRYERTPAGDFGNRSLECAEVLFPQNWVPGDPVFFDGAQLVEELLPFFDLHPGIEVSRLYENHADPAWRPGALPETRDSVLAALNAGANQTLIVGHGGIRTVSVGKGTLDENDFLSLTNNNQLSSLRFLGAQAARWDSGGLALAALMAPEGGAAIAIGGTNVDFPTATRFVMTEYYRLVYQEGVTAHGEAMGRSILPFLPFTAFDGVLRWTVMTQALLGDPALRAYTSPRRAHRAPVEAAPADLQVDIQLRRPRGLAGVPEVEITLGGAEPARLEVLDMAGRRVDSRELLGLAPGSHTLRLDVAASLAPGLYWLRLTQNGMSAHARAVVLR